MASEISPLKKTMERWKRRKDPKNSVSPSKLSLQSLIYLADAHLGLGFVISYFHQWKYQGNIRML